MILNVYFESKIIGSYVVTRKATQDKKTAFDIGIELHAHRIMALVIDKTAFEANIISLEIFSMLFYGNFYKSL